MRKHHVSIAVATDSNPGTSPMTSLLLALNMAATLFGLTVDECLAGATRNAARALGLAEETGTLEAGKWADFMILGANPLDDIRNTRAIAHVYISGREVRNINQ